MLEPLKVLMPVVPLALRVEPVSIASAPPPTLPPEVSVALTPMVVVPLERMLPVLVKVEPLSRVMLLALMWPLA